ncbi:MAG TPA: hypothetical protein VFV49_05095 [Thermoanaerobaculia bacterium]|nr:hypothetical protein [Thermoanaerobaculia bacterium]
MNRKIMIAAVLLFASLFATTSDAGGYQRWVIYYSDSTFSTPVGKKFQPSSEQCDPPYDVLHQTGSTTIYRYVQVRDVCGTIGEGATCDINGTYVSCPAGLDWVEDWGALGQDW